MSSNKAKDMTVKYSDLEIERISASELQENERSKVQQIAYVRYDHKVLGHDQALLIQLPKIHLETYGVPRPGEFYKNDRDRSFVKIPLNESDPDVLIFANKLKEIDAYLSSPKFASKLLGKKWQKYTYVPVYRPPTVTQDDDDDDDDNKKKSTKKPGLNYPYMKLKLDTDYDSGKIKTQVYRPEIINNKRERVEVSDIESIDDFSRILCYQCKFLAIIRGVKIWAQPPAKNNPMWGVSFKMIKVEVEPPVKNNSTYYKDYMNSDAFLDSDEENNIPNKQAVQIDSDDSDNKEIKPVKKPSSKKVAQVDSDDSDEEEPKPVKKISTKKVAQVDSDDSDEEEPKPDTKAPDKKVSQIDSDDSDNKDTKPIENTSNKKVVQDEPNPVKKIPDKKIAQVDSDDSDEEEPKPLKKTPDKKVVLVDSDDSDEEEPKPLKKTPDKKVVLVESDDSDEEETKPVKKILAKKIPDKKVVPVESDDSDEEETKPVKKTLAKKTHDKKVVPIESDDSDEEPKSVKKPSSKKVIHVESDSDDDKPQPPVKKPVSKTTGARSGKSKSTNA